MAPRPSKSTSQAVLEKVGRHHLAFLRSYLDGLDLAASHARYLGTPDNPTPDLRLIRSKLRWIRQELIVTANRRGKDFKDARLILIDPEKLRYERKQVLPTLEAFREERDPYEFFSENELLELYQTEFAGAAGGKPDRRTERNDRLRQRQIGVLGRLEHILAADPSPSDGVGGWLSPTIAKRLHDANIKTLGELVFTINAKGFNWWADVSRVGEKAARQIVGWLRTDYVKSTLGVDVHARALIKPRELRQRRDLIDRPKQTGIVPFETLIVPAELSGEKGSNRGLRCKISANNDYDAIQEWLHLYPADSHTRRSYRKEAERYLLWSVMEAGKPISDHTSADCVSYREFLRRLDPSVASGEWPFRIPRESWIGPKQSERWTSDWRPFAGPLSGTSQEHALVIIQALCRWLTGRRYLDSNPWDGLPRTGAGKARRFDRTRSFTFFQWKLLRRHMDSLPVNEKNERLRFVLFFLYATGLRLSEAVNARAGDVHHIFDVESRSESYEMHVIGKGGVDREVPIPGLLLREINRYMSYRQLGDITTCNPATPLIGKLRKMGRPRKEPLPYSDYPPPLPIIMQGDRDLGTSALYTALKGFFKDAASAYSDVLDPHTKQRFEKASTHWLRHTCGTHAVASGVPTEILQGILGHQSPETTAVYVEPDNLRRAQAMDKFMDGIWTKP